MGATVFKQAKVWSFPTITGRVGYVWSEETYDKKDGPKSASWCVMAIGRREHMIDRVFRLASSIPGGMLKVKNSSARNFITEMMAVVESPLQMSVTKLYLGNSDTSFYEAITNENRANAQQLFRQMGRTDLADAIEKSRLQGGVDGIEIDLAKDLDLIIALTGANNPSGKMISPCWSVVKFRSETAAPGVGEPPPVPTQKSVKLELFDTGMHSGFNGDSTLMCVLDGEPAHIGLDFHVEQFLVSYAGAQETAHPGLYKSLLNEYRIQSAGEIAKLSDETQFHVDSTGSNDLKRERVKSLSAKIVGEPLEKFSVTLGQLKKTPDGLGEFELRDHRWHVANLIANDDVTRVELAPARPEQEVVGETADGANQDIFEPSYERQRG